MKKLFLFLLSLPLLLCSCGNGEFFPPSRDVEDMGLVRVLGIDFAESGVTITGLTSGGTEGKGEVFSGDGQSVSEAVGRLVRLPAGKSAVFSHTESIIIGERAAGELFPEILDYIARSNELRLGVNIFIAKNGTAASLIEEGGDGLGELLDLVAESSPYLGSYAFSAGDCASALKRNGCCLVECLASGKEPEPDGFALICGGSLAQYLDKGESEGAAIIMNRLRGGEKALDGITLSLNGIKTAFSPLYKSGKLAGARLDIRLTAREAGASSGRGGRDAVQSALEKLENQELENVLSALAVCRSLGEDVFDIRASLMEAAPLASSAASRLHAGTMLLEVRLSAELTGSYDLREGSGI